jgi:threonine dehydrogenase-like Zn-dependent dehydrogenase
MIMKALVHNAPVPWTDFNCLRLPEDAAGKQNDYVMLADTFPTGYHATEMAGVRPGESVLIYGGGPVGLMAAYSATVKSAGTVMVVDRHPARLALAGQIGAIAIDDSEASMPGTRAGPRSSCRPPADRLRTAREWPCCMSGST